MDSEVFLKVFTWCSSTGIMASEEKTALMQTCFILHKVRLAFSKCVLDE